MGQNGNNKRLQLNKLYEKFEQLVSTQEEGYEKRDSIIHSDLYNKTILSMSWENIPSEIPYNIIESQIFLRGSVCFFKSDVYGYLCLPYTVIDGLNDYGLHTKIKPISLNNIDYGELTINEDCVIIKDNWLCIPPIAYCNMFADIINDCYKLKDKNRNFLSLPFIFNSTGDLKEDKKNALEIQQILTVDKVSLAVITNAFKQLNVIDLKPQYYGDELQTAIKDARNDFLEWLGVTHLSLEKRERMTEDEVNIMKENDILNINKRLKIRQQSADKINEIFGLNVSVHTTFSEV